ncbi:MAG TPA: BadF/BadG/BcrA/BcrD ATPase family protein [Candidatus Baltobacteraceae bacterium]
MLFAGVDGGQTATIALVSTEDGVVLGRGTGPAADLVGLPRSAARQAEAIDTAIDAARVQAGLPVNISFEAIVCGLSGYEDGELMPALRTTTRHIRATHDTESALAGALARDGIIVIAGTGSAALGVDERGARIRAGGWGYLFGDEGSAFWIARRALTVAMHRADRNETSSFAPALLERLGQPSLRAVQQAFAHGEIARSALASCAPIVLASAAAGDVEAQLVRSDAARALAGLVQRVHVRLAPTGERSVSYAGGVFGDEALRATWQAAVSERIPEARVHPPLAEPAAGALRLARESNVA